MSRNYVFNTGSGISLCMTSNQNVGFHTVKPSERLEFADGNAKFDSNIYVMKRVGVNMSNPAVELDIDGSAHLTGDITVEGDMSIYNPISVNGFYVTKNSNYALRTALSSAVQNIDVSPSGTIFALTNTSNNFRFVVTSNQTNILTIPGDGAANLYRDLNITGNIIPNSNITYNLGSATNRFKDLYLSGNTINLDGINISKDSTTGSIKVMDQATSNMIPLVLKEVQIQDGGKTFKIKYDSNINKIKFVSFSNNQEIDDISIPNIYTSNNLIGIGTSNPRALLHVTNDALFNTAKVGSYPSDNTYAMFSHCNVATTTSYALLQNSVGDTFLNAASTKCIKLRINNNDAVTVDSSGKLGVGTITPQAPVDVVGNIKASSNVYAMTRIGIATSNPAVSLEIVGTDAVLLPKGTSANRPAAPQQGHMRYNTDTSTFEGYGSGNTWGSLGGVKDTNQDTYISAESFPTSNDDVLRFYNSNIETMRLTKTGLLGIGTSNPTYTVDVTGTLRTTGSALIGTADNTVLSIFGNNLGFVKKFGAGAVLGYNNTNPFKISMLSQSDITTSVSTATVTDRFTIDNSGYVGIGTMTPSNALDVNGNIGIASASIPMGLMTEVGGTTPLLNLSVNYREPNKKTTYRGGCFRIDTRDSIPLFQWLSRPPSNGVEAVVMYLTEAGNLGIGASNPLGRVHCRGATTGGTTGQGFLDASNVPLYIEDVGPIRIVYKSGDSTVGAIYNYEPSKNVYWGETTDTGSYFFRGKNMVIQNGNVGIGTSNPSFKLHNALGTVFIGDIAYSTTTIPASATVPGLTTANGHRLVFDNTYNGTAGAGIAANKIVLHNNSNYIAGFGIENASVTYHSGLNHTFYVNANNPPSAYGTAVMMINSNTNIGINTRVPAQKLHIGGTTGSDTYLRIDAGATNNNYAGIMLNELNTNYGHYIRYNAATDNLEFGMNNSTTLTTYMTAMNNGNIGIGTSSPLSKFTIRNSYNDGISGGLCIDAGDGSIYNLRLYSYVQAGGQVAYKFTVNNTTSTNDALSIGYNGSIGIGTTSPAYKLHVAGGLSYFPEGLIAPGIHAQYTLNGGGNVSFISNNLLWSNRVIAIPAAGRGQTGGFTSDGYINMTCPTSGTITYYNDANVTTTVTCTANGIPMQSNWVALFYEITYGQGPTDNQANFRLVHFLNSTWRPSTNWVLIACTNWDQTNVKWMPGNTYIPNGGTFYSSTCTNSWMIAGTSSYIPKFSSTNAIAANSLIYDTGTNIGIGTTSPGQRLDVYATGRASYLRISGDTGAQQAIEFYDTTSRWIIYKDSNDTALKWYCGATGDKMALLANGRLGLGTNSPGTRFHVSGGTSGDWGSRFEHGSVNTYLSHNGGYGAYISTGTASSSTYALHINNGSSDIFTIRNDGYVKVGDAGVSQASISYKFHVTGDIYANGGWLRVSGNNGLWFESHSLGLIPAVNGDYGTVETTGTGKGNWEGYSIDGRYVFMSQDNNQCGWFNDVDNQWIMYFDRSDINNRYCQLRYNGDTKLTTTSYGVYVQSRITVDAGSGTAGYYFTENPGGGGGDAAWIRYYPRTGEACTLEIGVGNDGDDNIFLNPSGNVGIGTSSPDYKLQVGGNIKGNEIYNDGWFRNTGQRGLYNQDYQCHFYPNEAEYGNWRIHGNARNDWDGLRFTRNEISLMCGVSNRKECGFHYNGMGWAFFADGDRNLYVTGDITAYYSDRRLKENLLILEDFDSVLKSLTGYRFTWNEKGQKILTKTADEVDVGLIAQDVQAVIPQAVKINKAGISLDDKKESFDYFTIKYEKIIPFLVEGYKAHSNRFEALEAENRNLFEALEAENRNLQTQNTEISLLKSENESLHQRLERLERLLNLT